MYSFLASLLILAIRGLCQKEAVVCCSEERGEFVDAPCTQSQLDSTRISRVVSVNKPGH